MKRIITVLLIVSILLISTPAARAEVSVSAGAAVLYCPQNNEVYYSLNENTRMKMASTTKIMTALLTLEYAEKDNKQVRFTQKMTAEGSSMYLKYGEVLTLRDLAVGILMCSGNDAANAAAISIAGDCGAFAALMNKRAREIGMNNTNFVTPSGLDDENHYSTAYDMALLMAHALKNPGFAELTAKKNATVSFIEPAEKSVTYSNHNRLLSLFPDCVGGKTGYTMAAGRCLVTAARRDGLTLIAVTLSDRNDWLDHVSMYNYGFENHCVRVLDDTDFYLDVAVVGGEEESVIASSGESSEVIVPPSEFSLIKREIKLDNFLYAPVKKGQKLGKVEYYLNGRRIACHKLTAMNKNSLSESRSFWEKLF